MNRIEADLGSAGGSRPARRGETVRIGIVGVGGIGRQHVEKFLGGAIQGARLAAVCDADPAKLAAYPQVARYATYEAMFSAGDIDAVLVATPHFSHVPIGIAALEAGLHVLVEKPIAADRAGAERLLAAHRGRNVVFAAMFNQRTDPRYQTLRRLVAERELGALQRINWTVTDWFRSAAYYRTMGWRGTWAGEGGGILLNQCPHNLDLLQWIFGMPQRVTAFCTSGRYHDIEVEDDVTAYLEYADGRHATFIASTGEAPGTNRLEVAADRGRIVLEDGHLEWTRNAIGVREFSESTRETFSPPPHEHRTIEVNGTGGQHLTIIQNFVDAIADGVPLVAPAEEGLNSLELGNAMMLSSWTRSTVSLPLDSQQYETELRARIARSRRA